MADNNLIFFNKEGDSLNFKYDETLERYGGDILFHQNSSDTFKTFGLYTLENIPAFDYELPGELTLNKFQLFNEYGLHFYGSKYSNQKITKIEPVNNDSKFYSKWIYGDFFEAKFPIGSLIKFNQSTLEFTNLKMTYVVTASKKDAVLVVSNMNNKDFELSYSTQYNDLNYFLDKKLSGINAVGVYNFVDTSYENVLSDWSEPDFYDKYYLGQKLNFVNTELNNDIVGTVDIIINGDTSSSSSSSSNEINFYPSNPVGDANFTWEGNDLYVESNFDIGGIQLAFNTDFDYILSEELPSIERLDYTQEDSKILMLYSFNNTVIASSKTKILTRLDASQEFDIEQAVVGSTSGAKLNAVLNSSVLSTIDAPFQNKNLQFLNLYPNPAEGLVHLEYYLPNQMDQVVAKVYDLLGRLVHIQVLENREGISKTPMELSRLKTGNYIVLITANKGGSIKNIANKKLIIE